MPPTFKKNFATYLFAIGPKNEPIPKFSEVSWWYCTNDLTDCTVPTHFVSCVWDRIKGLILQRCGKLNFTNHGKLRPPQLMYCGAAVHEILLCTAAAPQYKPFYTVPCACFEWLQIRVIPWLVLMIRAQYKTKKLWQWWTLTIEYDKKFDNDEPYRLNMKKNRLNMTKKYLFFGPVQ